MLKKLKNKISYGYKLFVKKDPFIISARKWFRDKGDETLRLDYSLNESSVVFDVGGYKGDFAYAINRRYGCVVYIFEPSVIFFNECKLRFLGNEKIKCFNFGLSSESGCFLLSDEDNASSTIKYKDDLNAGEYVKLKKFFDFFSDVTVEQIDLLKVNIEGGEYDLLPHLIESGLIKKINNIQVQFHNFIEMAEEKRNEITRKLLSTHNMDWCYPFVWESWSAKKINYEE